MRKSSSDMCVNSGLPAERTELADVREALVSVRWLTLDERTPRELTADEVDTDALWCSGCGRRVEEVSCSPGACSSGWNSGVASTLAAVLG